MAVKIAHLYRGIWTSKRRCGWVIVFNRSSQSCFFFYTACEILCSKRQTEKTRFESTKFRKQIKFTRHAFWTNDTYTHVAHTFDCVIFKFSFLCGVVSMSLKAVGKSKSRAGVEIFGWKHGVSMFPQHAQQVNSSCGVLLPAAVKFSLRRKNSIESILFKRV